MFLGHCDIFSNTVLVGVGCFFSIGFFSKLDIIFSLFLRYYYNYPLLIF